MNDKTKDIRILQCCGIEGEVVEAGEIVTVSDGTARRLIGMGKAEPYLKPEAGA